MLLDPSAQTTSVQSISNSHLKSPYKYSPPTSDFETPFHSTVRVNSPVIAGLLLAHGFNPNLLNSEGMAPIQLAAQLGKDEVLRRLLYSSCTSKLGSYESCGVNPNTLGRTGYSPLHYAVLSDCRICVAALCQVSNLNVLNNDRETPLHLALKKKKEWQVRLFLSHDPAAPMNNDISLSEPDADGNNAMMLAILWGNSRIIRLMVSHRLFNEDLLTVPNNNRLTGLQLAVLADDHGKTVDLVRNRQKVLDEAVEHSKSFKLLSWQHIITPADDGNNDFEARMYLERERFIQRAGLPDDVINERIPETIKFLHNFGANNYAEVASVLKNEMVDLQVLGGIKKSIDDHLSVQSDPFLQYVSLTDYNFKHVIDEIFQDAFASNSASSLPSSFSFVETSSFVELDRNDDLKTDGSTIHDDEFKNSKQQIENEEPTQIIPSKQSLEFNDNESNAQEMETKKNAENGKADLTDAIIQPSSIFQVKNENDLTPKEKEHIESLTKNFGKHPAEPAININGFISSISHSISNFFSAKQGISFVQSSVETDPIISKEQSILSSIGEAILTAAEVGDCEALSKTLSTSCQESLLLYSNVMGETWPMINIKKAGGGCITELHAELRSRAASDNGVDVDIIENNSITEHGWMSACTSSSLYSLLHKMNNAKESVLSYAIKYDQIKIINKLIDLPYLYNRSHRTLLNLQGVDGETAFHAAVRTRSPLIVREMISRSLELNNGQIFCWKTEGCLIESDGGGGTSEDKLPKGGAINIKNSFGETALMLAVSFDLGVIVQSIIEHCVSVDASIPDSFGVPPISRAVALGVSNEVISHLLSHSSVCVSQEDAAGYTSVSYAILRGDMIILSDLIANRCFPLHKPLSQIRVNSLAAVKARGRHVASTDPTVAMSGLRNDADHPLIRLVRWTVEDFTSLALRVQPVNVSGIKDHITLNFDNLISIMFLSKERPSKFSASMRATSNSHIDSKGKESLKLQQKISSVSLSRPIITSIGQVSSYSYPIIQAIPLVDQTSTSPVNNERGSMDGQHYVAADANLEPVENYLLPALGLISTQLSPAMLSPTLKPEIWVDELSSGYEESLKLMKEGYEKVINKAQQLRPASKENKSIDKAELSSSGSLTQNEHPSNGGVITPPPHSAPAFIEGIDEKPFKALMDILIPANSDPMAANGYYSYSHMLSLQKRKPSDRHICNVKDKYGRTPLWWAVKENKSSLVLRILELYTVINQMHLPGHESCDPHSPDAHGEMPWEAGMHVQHDIAIAALMRSNSGASTGSSLVAILQKKEEDSIRQLTSLLQTIHERKSLRNDDSLISPNLEGLQLENYSNILTRILPSASAATSSPLNGKEPADETSSTGSDGISSFLEGGEISLTIDELLKMIARSIHSSHLKKSFTSLNKSILDGKAHEVLDEELSLNIITDAVKNTLSNQVFAFSSFLPGGRSMLDTMHDSDKSTKSIIIDPSKVIKPTFNNAKAEGKMPLPPTLSDTIWNVQSLEFYLSDVFIWGAPPRIPPPNHASYITIFNVFAEKIQYSHKKSIFDVKSPKDQMVILSILDDFNRKVLDAESSVGHTILHSAHKAEHKHAKENVKVVDSEHQHNHHSEENKKSPSIQSANQRRLMAFIQHGDEGNDKDDDNEEDDDGLGIIRSHAADSHGSGVQAISPDVKQTHEEDPQRSLSKPHSVGDKTQILTIESPREKNIKDIKAHSSAPVTEALSANLDDDDDDDSIPKTVLDKETQISKPLPAASKPVTSDIEPVKSDAEVIDKQSIPKKKTKTRQLDSNSSNDKINDLVNTVIEETFDNKLPVISDLLDTKKEGHGEVVDDSSPNQILDSELISETNIVDSEQTIHEETLPTSQVDEYQLGLNPKQATENKLRSIIAATKDTEHTQFVHALDGVSEVNKEEGKFLTFDNDRILANVILRTPSVANSDNDFLKDRVANAVISGDLMTKHLNEAVKNLENTMHNFLIDNRPVGAIGQESLSLHMDLPLSAFEFVTQKRGIVALKTVIDEETTIIGNWLASGGLMKPSIRDLRLGSKDENNRTAICTSISLSSSSAQVAIFNLAAHVVNNFKIKSEHLKANGATAARNKANENDSTLLNIISKIVGIDVDETQVNELVSKINDEDKESAGGAAFVFDPNRHKLVQAGAIVELAEGVKCAVQLGKWDIASNIVAKAPIVIDYILSTLDYIYGDRAHTTQLAKFLITSAQPSTYRLRNLMPTNALANAVGSLNTEVVSLLVGAFRAEILADLDRAQLSGSETYTSIIFARTLSTLGRQDLNEISDPVERRKAKTRRQKIIEDLFNSPALTVDQKMVTNTFIVIMCFIAFFVLFLILSLWAALKKFDATHIRPLSVHSALYKTFFLYILRTLTFVRFDKKEDNKVIVIRVICGVFLVACGILGGVAGMNFMDRRDIAGSILIVFCLAVFWGWVQGLASTRGGIDEMNFCFEELGLNRIHRQKKNKLKSLEDVRTTDEDSVFGDSSEKDSLVSISTKDNIEKVHDNDDDDALLADAIEGENVNNDRNAANPDNFEGEILLAGANAVRDANNPQKLRRRRQRRFQAYLHRLDYNPVHLINDSNDSRTSLIADLEAAVSECNFEPFLVNAVSTSPAAANVHVEYIIPPDSSASIEILKPKEDEKVVEVVSPVDVSGAIMDDDDDDDSEFARMLAGVGTKEAGAAVEINSDVARRAEEEMKAAAAQEAADYAKKMAALVGTSGEPVFMRKVKWMTDMDIQGRLEPSASMLKDPRLANIFASSVISGSLSFLVGIASPLARVVFVNYSPMFKSSKSYSAFVDHPYKYISLELCISVAIFGYSLLCFQPLSAAFLMIRHRISEALALRDSFSPLDICSLNPSNQTWLYVIKAREAANERLISRWAAIRPVVEVAVLIYCSTWVVFGLGVSISPDIKSIALRSHIGITLSSLMCGLGILLTLCATAAGRARALSEQAWRKFSLGMRLCPLGNPKRILMERLYESMRLADPPLTVFGLEVNYSMSLCFAVSLMIGGTIVFSDNTLSSLMNVVK